MSAIKKIPISQLRLGMYIHEMDISWMQTPFRLHRRKVTSQQEIISLQKAGAKIVSIDIEKGVDIDVDIDIDIDIDVDINDGINKENNQIDSSPGLIEQSSDGKTDKVSLNEELIEAKRIQKKIQQLVQHLNNDIISGEPIDVKGISAIIDDTIKSLKRNDQALLTLLHIHRKDIRLDTHAFGVFSTILLLALKTRCSNSEIETLAMAAILHDCGWSKLPINLFGKAKAYTKSEKKLIEQHIVIAKKAFKVSKGIPKDVIELIIQHHELANGQGYPKKYKAKQLHPLHAYLQIADIYDESIHGLGDHPGALPANTLSNLYKMATKGYFSETLVSELVRLLGVYPISSVVRLTSNEVAMVVEINRKLPLLPKVKIIFDVENQLLDSSLLIDLSNDSKNRLIQGVLEPSILSKSTQN